MHFFLLISLLSSALFASAPYNSNLLVEHRIDPKILNNIVSSTRQNVAYRMKINHTIEDGIKKKNLEYFLIVDPYPSYGTELKIQIAKDSIKKVDIPKVKKDLDKLMGMQLYLQHGDLFDKDSFEIFTQKGDEEVISFKLKPSSLPRELKHLRDMDGYIYIKNSILTKIELKNNKRINYGEIEVDSYRKTLYFKRVKTGGYLLSRGELQIVGSKENQPYVEKMLGEVKEYWNIHRELIDFQKGITEIKAGIDRGDFETIELDLDRFFPILGKEARKAGFDLPKPFGVTLVNMFQDTTMHMTSFKIDGVDINFNKVLDGDSTYKSLTYAPLIRADLWVLPFVSFSAIFGITDTTTNVTLASNNGLNFHSPFPIPGGSDHQIIAPGSKLNLDPFSTNAFLYGLGATVAGGFENYFTTIDFQYIVAYTPAADVSVDMMIITPLVGYILSDYGTKLFIGAQYQRLAQSLTFKVPTDKGEMSGVVGLRSEEWAGVLGLDYSFTRNWSTNILYSQGKDRKNLVVNLSYRF